jgi:hypothetical protein
MKPRLLGPSLRLRPVLELAPTRFAEVPYPDDPGLSHTERADRYWRAAMRAALLDVEPVRPASWFVYADAIASPEPLRSVLRAHFAAGDPPGDLEEVGALAGGLALLDDGAVVLLPTCCGDMGNLSEWRETATYREPDPRMVWIGHPWLSAWYESGALMIREEQEYHQPVTPMLLRVQPDALLAAVERAEDEVEGLRQRIASELRAGAVPDLGLDREAVSAVLVKGW